MGLRIKKKSYIEAIKASRGLVTLAAEMLGVSRAAVYAAAKRWPDVQQALEDARERTLDFTEGKLMEKVKEGDIAAIIFTLKTLGKHRGFVERVEQASEGEMTVRVRYENDPA